MTADNVELQGRRRRADVADAWSVEVDQRALAAAAAQLYRPLVQRPRTPEYLGTWISTAGGRMRLAATGPVMSAEVHLDLLGVTGQSGEASDGWVVAPMDIFTQLARRLPAGPVRLRAEDGLLHVQAAEFRMRADLIDPGTQVAPLLRADSHTVILVGSAEFAGAVTHVAFAGEAGSGWMDHAVPFSLDADGRLELMVTDRNHLALVLVEDLEIAGVGLAGERVLVPVPAVLGLDRVMSTTERVRIRVAEDQVDFEMGDVTLRAVVGGTTEPFPLPMSSMPRSHRMVVTRRSLATVIRRVSQAALDLSSVLWFGWDGETAVARTAQAERVQAEVSFPAEVSGAPFEIGIRLRLFGEMVSRLPEGRVMIEFEQHDKIVAISSDAHPGALYFTGLVAVPHLPWR